MRCLRPSKWISISELLFLFLLLLSSSTHYVDAGYEPIQGSEEDINLDILKNERRYLDRDTAASGDNPVTPIYSDNDFKGENRENFNENFFENQRRSILPLPRALETPGQKVVNYQALLDHENRMRLAHPRPWAPGVAYVPVSANSLVQARRVSTSKDSRFRQYVMSLNKILKRNALRLENEIILRDAIVKAMLQPPPNLYDEILHDPLSATEQLPVQYAQHERDSNPFIQRYQKMKLDAMLKRRQVHPLNKFRGAPFTGDRRFWAPTGINSIIAGKQQERMILDKKKHLFFARKDFLDAVKRYNDLRRFRQMSMLQRQAKAGVSQRRNQSGNQIQTSRNIVKTPMLRDVSTQSSYQGHNAKPYETVNPKRILQRNAPKVVKQVKDLEKAKFFNQTRALSRINTAKLLASALQRIHSRLSSLKKGPEKNSAPSLMKMKKLINELNSHKGHEKLPLFQPLMQAINNSLKAKDKIRITEIPLTRSLSSLNKLKSLINHDSPPSFLSIPKGSGDFHLKLVSVDQSIPNCRTLNNENQVIIIQSPQFDNLKDEKDIKCRDDVPVTSPKGVRNTTTRNYTTDDSVIKMSLGISKDNKKIQHLLFSKLPNITSMLPIKNITLPKEVLKETLDQFGHNKAQTGGKAAKMPLKTPKDVAGKLTPEATNKNRAPNLSNPKKIRSGKVSAHSKAKPISSTKDIYPNTEKAKSKFHSLPHSKPLPSKVTQSLKLKAQKQYQNSQIVKQKESNKILSAQKEHDLSNLEIKASAGIMANTFPSSKKQEKSNQNASKRDKQKLYQKTPQHKHLSFASKRVLHQLRANRGSRKHLQKSIHHIAGGDKKSNVGNASYLNVGRTTQNVTQPFKTASFGTQTTFKSNEIKNEKSTKKVKANSKHGIAPRKMISLNSSKVIGDKTGTFYQNSKKASTKIDMQGTSVMDSNTRALLSHKKSQSGWVAQSAKVSSDKIRSSTISGSRRNKGPDIDPNRYNHAQQSDSANPQTAASVMKANAVNQGIASSDTLGLKGENNSDSTTRHRIPIQDLEVHLVRSSETDDSHDPSTYAASPNESKLSLRHGMEGDTEEKKLSERKIQSTEIDQDQYDKQDQAVDEHDGSHDTDDTDGKRPGINDVGVEKFERGKGSSLNSETNSLEVSDSNTGTSTDYLTDASKSEAPSLSPYFEDYEEQYDGVKDALPPLEEGSDDDINLKTNLNHGMRDTSLTDHHHRHHHHHPHVHHHHRHQGHNRGIRKHKVSFRHPLRHHKRFHRHEDTVR